MWAHNQIRTWAGIHSAGSQCSWFRVQTESNGVVTGMTKHLPLLCTITTCHWALQQHTHKYSLFYFRPILMETQHVRCMYLWPGAQPPLSRAQVAIAVSAGLWALVAAVTAADGFELAVAQRLDTAYGACLSSRLPTRLTAFTPLSSHPAKHIETNITAEVYLEKRSAKVSCVMQRFNSVTLTSTGDYSCRKPGHLM